MRNKHKMSGDYMRASSSFFQELTQPAPPLKSTIHMWMYNSVWAMTMHKAQHWKDKLQVRYMAPPLCVIVCGFDGFMQVFSLWYFLCFWITHCVHPPPQVLRKAPWYLSFFSTGIYSFILSSLLNNNTQRVKKRFYPQ